MNILRIDGSMRRTGSVSRQLTDEVIDNLISQTPGAAIRVRDLANP
jgi:FMN-dependent NADH-azoreductase